MAPDRLRVAVPQALRTGRRDNGHLHMWNRVLERLDTVCVLVDASQPTRFRRPHVWLYDGHDDPPPGAGPVRVAQLHEASWTDERAGHALDPSFLAAIEARTARAVDEATMIITPSQASRAQLIASGADPGRVTVVPHGVDHAIYRTEASQRSDDVLRRLGAHDGRPYVLFVSQLHPRKGIDTLRDAIERLADDGYPHRLVVIGGRPADRADGGDIVAAARAPLPRHRDRVIAGEALPDEDLAALMAGAAAFCLPSLMEGFGLPVLEAMACGAPVVVSARGSLPEVVGDAGLVVEPESARVAEALARLFDDPSFAAGLGQRAAERAACFDWDRTAAGWLAVLRAAVSLRGGAGRVRTLRGRRSVELIEAPRPRRYTP